MYFDIKRTRRGTTEASSSRPNRQCPTASTRTQRAAPQDHFEDTIEVEDVAATHDSNVEVHAKPTEPSRVGPIVPSLLTSFKTHIAAAIWNNQEREPLRCMSKTSTLREWNWWGNLNNGIFKWLHLETNTFHMLFGEMTITLDDVSSILGIPVSSAAVAPLEDE
ncbi:hypothetical protein L3X38_025992 [Prunus dulcis]|uniref:Aminotransferase-like plant mobile domain-containing protein n=1 Tax=Prunus dulcis TaxID=3755 RepID=A0AAD4Z8I9_PRUDU|nr:hypothetical protein L3X38_025992 [Prunus dulcis]